MFSLLTRARRGPAAPRHPFTRLSVERLEGREAPSSLDVTSSLAPPDLTSPADSQTSAAGGGAGALVLGGTTTTTSAPQAAAGTTAAPALVAAAPAPVASNPHNLIAANDPAMLPPVINDVGGAVNPDVTCTVKGDVIDPSPATLTVSFTGWAGLNGASAPVKADGTFAIDVDMPPNNTQSAVTLNGTAVAGNGGGRVSAPMSFEVTELPH